MMKLRRYFSFKKCFHTEYELIKNDIDSYADKWPIELSLKLNFKESYGFFKTWKKSLEVKINHFFYLIVIFTDLLAEAYVLFPANLIDAANLPLLLILRLMLPDL